MATEKGPLSRWARRKAASRKRTARAPAIDEAPSAVPAATDAGGGTPGGESQAGSRETPPPDLPDIDSLTAESDFSVFMREGVPAELRRLALRKLWTSDPVLANLDGLVDYGEDYTHIKSGVIEALAEALESEPPAPEKSDRQDGGTEPDAPAPSVAEAVDERGEVEERPGDVAATDESGPDPGPGDRG